MDSPTGNARCDQTELVSLYALGALPRTQVILAAKHLASCPECREVMDALRGIVGSFAAWPTDVLRPSADLWDRLVTRIADSGQNAGARNFPPWSEPDWEQPAPGISCKLLSTDSQRDHVAMLVRLDPGAAYPPHTHAATEELHLLDGELWIDEKKLYPGDYNRAERGTTDRRVWSETGCTCLLMTASADVLR